MADMRVIKKCSACRQPFVITQNEALWLQKKGLSLFERCFECRKKRREEKCQMMIK